MKFMSSKERRESGSPPVECCIVIIRNDGVSRTATNIDELNLRGITFQYESRMDLNGEQFRLSLMRFDPVSGGKTFPQQYKRENCLEQFKNQQLFHLKPAAESLKSEICRPQGMATKRS